MYFGSLLGNTFWCFLRSSWPVNTFWCSFGSWGVLQHSEYIPVYFGSYGGPEKYILVFFGKSFSTRNTIRCYLGSLSDIALPALHPLTRL